MTNKICAYCETDYADYREYCPQCGAVEIRPESNVKLRPYRGDHHFGKLKTKKRVSTQAKTHASSWWWEELKAWNDIPKRHDEQPGCLFYLLAFGVVWYGIYKLTGNPLVAAGIAGFALFFTVSIGYEFG